MDKGNSQEEQKARAGAGVRCAIYTRKSTEEGLEQAFNSLDAQREAAEAYIQSQRALGWSLVETRYDDGGCSGGNLDRPALQRLLEHIAARQIDCVVVYKVDRLSRSLLDFARLMDRFEQFSVSFVSVTQQFNTTTSLGRLTLNILLSFAQFEREIISERTRDKMGAARRKGKWVGGTPLLGYDVDPAGGRLVLNPGEAQRVGAIYQLFQAQGSLAAVVAELAQRRWTTKSWVSRQQIRHPGRPFTKTSLRLLLTNPTYAGRVRYGGVIYPGEHPAIVGLELWESVNGQFSQREKPQPERHRRGQDAPLAGLLLCETCQQPMRATYTEKGGRRYRYYVCDTAREQGWGTCATKSVSADLLEASLARQLAARWNDVETAPAWRLADGERQALGHAEAAVMARLVEQIRYAASGAVWVKLRRGPESGDDEAGLTFGYQIPGRGGRGLAAFRRQGVGEVLSRPPRLARLVALAHKLEALVRSGGVKDCGELARLARVSAARIGQILLLAQLAPTIQEQILFLPAADAAPIAERALREVARELDWDRQRVRFAQLVAAHG